VGTDESRAAGRARRIGRHRPRRGTARARRALGPRRRSGQRLLDRDATAARDRGGAPALTAAAAARRADRGLDPAGVRDMGALLNELSSGGAAVLISSHQIAEIEDVCGAFTVLRRGQTVWDGTAAELREPVPGSVPA